MSLHDHFTVSLAGLMNIVNACTDQHVSSDYILTLLEEMGIADRTSIHDPNSNNRSPTSSRRQAKARASPPSSGSLDGSLRSAPLTEGSDIDSELAMGFGAMGLSSIRAGGAIGGGHLTSQVTAPPNAPRPSARRVEHTSQSSPGSELPAGSPVREHVAVTTPGPSGVQRVAKGRLPASQRWYCVTNGVRVGVIYGWNDTKAVTFGYPSSCQHESSSAEAATQEFLDFALTTLGEIKPSSGIVVGIDGIKNMKQLRRWVEAQKKAQEAILSSSS
ncbi:hypothetical protein FA13DRAFT_1793880 [Coprinellus micaceus]|uniref:Uncharacterized protein n=1 Tax=Coprinellus micaceus TaxID=71717 RepID=A0A4Y7T3N0_COPMI|nr:hypothetical protein FA13DRAFT_1793880 [Coprinellus micaceus]